MVYLRKKKVKDMDYIYLVKSIWDKKRKTSRQITIKYLGEASLVTRDDIPSEFRDNPKINAFLLDNTSGDRSKREELTSKIQNQLFNSFTEGELKSSINIYQSFTNKSSIEQFYQTILKPVMEKVGRMWESGRLSIATEHIASNTAQSLIKIISANHKKTNLDKGKIILTTPVGEEHCLSCNMIESYLLSKGFTTFNLSPSTPGSSLIEFIKTIHPTAVLISITLEDNIRSGQRLAKKINSSFKRLPIFIGGQALIGKKSKFNATVMPSNTSLDQLPKILVSKRR